MDALARQSAPSTVRVLPDIKKLDDCFGDFLVRVLPDIKKLDDCFGDFLVRVVCECGTCHEIQPQALARLVGWKVTLKELALRDALLEMREESCRGGGSGKAQAMRGPRRIRG